MLSEDQLHPTVREFKNFINKHPKIIEDVRKSGKEWQEYYEKWVLLGEDDPMWEQYKESKLKQKKKDKSDINKSELLDQIMKITKNLDIEKVQTHVEQLSNTLATVQEMLGHFQPSDKSQPSELNKPDPFNLFRD